MITSIPAMTKSLRAKLKKAGFTPNQLNKIIEIKAREAKRVQIFMDDANQSEKAIIFCATQDHAAAVRDLVANTRKAKTPLLCSRYRQ